MALGDIAADLGLPVFPCGHDKKPVIATGFKAATRDRAVILESFNRPGAELIGVPTGSSSGLIVIDVDIRPDKSGMGWLEENSEALPPTRTHKTRSGGLHLLFRAPDSVDIRNSASRVAPGVDVRGEGGYVIVPPSPGYSLADPVEPAEMPRWLIRACLREDPPAPPQRPQDRHERYTQAAIDGEVLAVVRAAEGTRNDTLHRAAVKLGTLVAAGQMARATAEAELQRAGQMAGLESREVTATIKSGLDFGTQHPREMPESRAFPTFEPDSEPPETPDDPGYWQSVAIDAPPPAEEDEAPSVPIYDPWNALRPVSFPLEAIPPILRNFVEDRSRIIGADPAAIAWAAISACSAAIDGRVRLQLKRHDHWSVPPAIWMALVGAPSTKKTPIIDTAWHPLHRIQAKELKTHQLQHAAWKSQPKEERARAPEPQIARRLISHDATMESLQELLSKQDRGIGVLRDELAGWIGSMEKYAPGKGGAADRAFALQSYNGGPHVVDRVMRGTIPINNLLVTVCGGIQPERLRQFGDLTDDGLWQRFVPIIVAPAGMGTDEAPSDAVEQYERIIERLLGTPGQVRLRLSDEAHAIRDDVQRRVYRLEQSEALGGRFVGFCGKLVGLWGRLTLVLHCLAAPGSEVVSETTAGAARTLLFRSALPNAARVYAAMGGAGADLEATQSIAGYVLSKGLHRIVISDLTRNVRVCRHRSMEDVRRLLSPLEAGGWLRPEKEFGPTSWLVNEHAHQQFAQRAEREIERRATLRALIVGDA